MSISALCVALCCSVSLQLHFLHFRLCLILLFLFSLALFKLSETCICCLLSIPIMAGLTNSAIIVIVLVVCLAVTALGASLFKHYKPADGETPFSPGYEQKLYMAEVRARGFETLQQACWGRDVESRCKFHFVTDDHLANRRLDVPGPSYYRPHIHPEDTNTNTASF